MSGSKKTARFAGLLYLIVVLGGIASLAYVPNVIESGKHGAALVSSIQTNQSLFRFGIAAGLVCYTAFLLLPIVLYRLLAPFGQQAAVAMVALATASVPVAFSNLIHRMDILSLVVDEPRLATLAAGQLQTEVLLALESYWNGIAVLTIFWGLWLLPFGWLMFRSQLIPRILALLLMAGCFGYVIAFFGRLFVPDFTQLTFARYLTLPASLGEIGTCLWLLVMGVRDAPAIPDQPGQNPTPARQS